MRSGTSVAWFNATPALISAKNSLGFSANEERIMPYIGNERHELDIIMSIPSPTPAKLIQDVR